MPVVGMGGYFFRAKDPAALKAGYRDHLGVGGGCGTDLNGQSNEWVCFARIHDPRRQPDRAVGAGRAGLGGLLAEPAA